jgi:nitrite reductase/ring-hydroxylating ferredoxin subunit
VNRCPHVGTPLDWAENEFLDREGRHIVCATHGALFRIDDGRCVAGPCQGDRLEPFPFWHRPRARRVRRVSVKQRGLTFQRRKMASRSATGFPRRR